jgi:hypothetical protein
LILNTILTPFIPRAAVFDRMLVHSITLALLLPGTGATIKNPARAPVVRSCMVAVKVPFFAPVF